MPTEGEEDFPVTVERKVGRGRCVVAIRDIGEGEEVLKSLAYGIGVCEERKHNVCSHCWLESVDEFNISCNHCKEFFYCSISCKTMHQHAFGSLECKAMEKVSQFNGSYVEDQKSDIKVLIFMLCKVLNQCNKEVGGNEEDINNIHSQLTQACYSPTFTQVFELEGHENEYCEDFKTEIRRVARDTVAIFDSIIHDEETIPEAYNTIMNENTVYKLLCKFKCNNYGLWNEQDECLGCFLFVSASYVNHSCVPNSRRYPDKVKSHTTIRTLRPIAQGEEITISYIDNSEPFSVRNEILSSAYFFLCDCPKCKAQY